MMVIECVLLSFLGKILSLKIATLLLDLISCDKDFRVVKLSNMAGFEGHAEQKVLHSYIYASVVNIRMQLAFRKSRNIPHA